MANILDYCAAIENLDNDVEIYQAVADAYFETTPSLIEDMRRAALVGDWETYHRHAHSMKSSSRTVGGMRLGDIAEAVEKSTPSNAVEALPEINLVESEYLALKEAVMSMPAFLSRS